MNSANSNSESVPMTLPHRLIVLCTAAFAIGLPMGAYAAVVVTVDKSTQRMSVAVDGTPRYSWAVSTGRAGYAERDIFPHPAGANLVLPRVL